MIVRAGRMYLFLVRHVEARKNVSESFSGTPEQDALTSEGVSAAAALARDMETLGVALPGGIKEIVCSTSPRAKATAAAIGERLAAPVRWDDRLRSIGSGALSGVTETSAWRTHPQYMKALQLYRAGLLNSYDIPEFEEKETKSAFEARVAEAMLSILATPHNKIVVTQRSPITAILIWCARQTYNYPADFFGHVQLDLGCASLVSIFDGIPRLHVVNWPTRSLIKALEGGSAEVTAY